MAGTTGLEPATSAVTGQRSNQLNYVPFNNLQAPDLSVSVVVSVRILTIVTPGFPFRNTNLRNISLQPLDCNQLVFRR